MSSEARKLAAILVADVVGFSRLVATDEEGTLSRLRGLLGGLIEPAVASRRGRVVKRTGDGYIAEFRSAVDAIRCALNVQDAMIDRNSGAPEDQRIIFRIGIHVGDVVEEEDGDLMGDTVNVAARLEAICEPGGVCASEDAYRQVKSRLDLCVADLGPQRLKNMAEPVRAYLLRQGSAKASGSAKPARPRRRLALVAGAVMSIGLLALGAYGWRTGLTTLFGASSVVDGVVGSAPPLSMVVLPFQSIGGDAGQSSLADAVAEDLTIDLSRLTDRHVIAPSMASAYRARPIDPKQIGRELGVRYLLEGSLSRLGEKTVVKAQLVSTGTGAIVWADRFDVDGGEARSRPDIVARIARSVDLELLQEESLRSLRERPDNPGAVDLRLRGEAIVRISNASVATLNEAVRLLERAHELDPQDERTMTALAAAIALKTDFSSMRPPSVAGTAGNADAASLWRAEKLLAAALALKPDDSWAHWTKGYIFSMKGLWSSAVREAEKAIEDDPANLTAYGHAGYWKMALGRSADGLADVETALRLGPRDPQAPSWRNYLCYLYAHLALWDQAIEACEKAAAANPGAAGPIGDLVAAYAWSGRDREARETARQLIAVDRHYVRSLQSYADAHDNPTFRQEVARIIEGLRRAGVTEEPATPPESEAAEAPLSSP